MPDPTPPTAPDTSQAIGTGLEDYQTVYDAGSASHEAARDADIDAAHPAGLDSHDKLAVGRAEISAGFALGQVDAFRERIDHYFEARGDDAYLEGDAYRSMTFQRNGFIKDVNALQQANLAWNLLAAAGEHYGREVVRVDAMQEMLPQVAADDTNFTTQLAPHKHALMGSVHMVGGINGNQGSVSLAARDFTGSRDQLTAACYALTNLIANDLMKPLLEKQEKKGAHRDEIKEKMERLARRVEGISAAISTIGRVAEVATPLATEEGLTAATEIAHGLENTTKAGKGGEVGEMLGGTIADAIWGPDLRLVENQIMALDAEKATWEDVKAQNTIQAIKQAWMNAKANYIYKWQVYQTAMANRRAAYADTAKATDAAEAKKHIGKEKDPVQQVMLYLSAVREAKIAADDANRTKAQAEQMVDAAVDSIREHAGDGVNSNNPAVHQWWPMPGERDNMSIDQRPDQQLLHSLQKKLRHFTEDSKQETARLDKLDQSAAKAMFDDGGLSGVY